MINLPAPLCSWMIVLVALTALAGCVSSEKKEEVVLGDPWFRAARTSDIAVMAGMIKAGKKVDEPSAPGLTALMVASRAGNPETVKWLLAQGADASKLDRDGQSALVYGLTGLATEVKRERIVEELIAAGADPFKIDRLGFQPVIAMMEFEMDAVVRRLRFTDKKPCDRVPKLPDSKASLSQIARQLENVPLAEFLEAQGCW